MNKSIRNPFPWIGKVFKYEMLHSIRILLPVYAATILLAPVVGLLLKSFPNGENINFNFTTNINGVESAMSQVTGFVLFLFFGIAIASAVVTVIILTKRFKTGLLGDEAYLNLTLPVTIGEHLWGRILAVVVWIAAFFVTMLISLFLCILIVDAKSLDFKNFGNFASVLLMGVCGTLALILFIFMINAIGHLAKKHRTFVKLLAVIVILSTTAKFMGNLNYYYFQSTQNSAGAAYVTSLFALILCVIYGTITYFILKLKLNLE